jgi:histidinol dehydrogenase
VGPGNAFVAAAKARVAADCPIDFHAGPSEIAIVAASGNARWMAADLVAQAEHDPAARAVLFTPNPRLAGEVASAVAGLISRHPAARQSLEQHGGIVVTRSMPEAVALVNRMAPEHLVCENDQVAAAVTHAGAIFVGEYAAQAAGDYATGSNHVLPTGGAARSRGGLSAADFVRTTSVQRLTRRGLGTIGPAAIALATAEGLAGHAESIAVRLEGRPVVRRRVRSR